MTPPRKLRSWTEFETRYASGGGAVPEPTPEVGCMLARVQKSNYRLAEAFLLAQTGAVDAIQETRTLIFRGRLAEAEHLLDGLLSAEILPEPLVFIDLVLELARVHYQNGEWARAIETVNKVMEHPETNGVTRITLLQVRSAALFELGEWPLVLRDIERIRSLHLLYPKSRAAFYSEVLAVKTLARREGADAAERAWRALLERQLAPAPQDAHVLNADIVLTLLRLRLDLDRTHGRPVAATALACLRLAEAMGDDLYAAHACVDLAYSESDAGRAWAGPRLAELRMRFEKIGRLLREVEGPGPRSQSAEALARSGSAPVGAGEGLCSPECARILIPAWGVRIELGDLSIHRLKIQDRSRRILDRLGQGACDSQTLFEAGWNIRFRPERHGAILRTALVRLRRQSGVGVLTRDGSIGLENTLLLAL